MPRYEVLVPAAPPALPEDLTLRVEAEHWLAALKEGLDRIGSPGIASNVLCDVREDGSIHVTDPMVDRVFRIVELDSGPIPAASRSSPPGAGAPPSRGAPAAARPAVPSRIGRAPGPPDPADLLAEVFERVAELDRQRDRRSGLAFLLDLALEKLDCEAGSVFLARLGGRELEFVVVRGPRAGEIQRLGLTVPLGTGIVGFCARENVAVAVSDAEKDPRFHRAVSRAIGYETRSVLCAPIARQGRVLGALEVLNRRGGRPFERSDLAVLSYLAHQAAELIGRLDG